MIMRSIRNKRQAFKIPMIIFTVILSISLVGFFAYSPLPVEGPQVDAHVAEVQEMLKQIRRLEHGLEIEPENEKLRASVGNRFYSLGMLYASHGEEEVSQKYFEEAVHSYLKALEINPQLVGVRVDLATVFFYIGEHDKAEEHFKQAVNDEPSFINGLINYGIFLYAVKEDREGAKEQWENALALNPDPLIKANIEDLLKNID